jgi:hypothetical protein
MICKNLRECPREWKYIPACCDWLLTKRKISHESRFLDKVPAGYWNSTESGGRGEIEPVRKVERLQ